jgi:mannan endo-1,4-beta-mannosidase
MNAMKRRIKNLVVFTLLPSVFLYGGCSENEPYQNDEVFAPAELTDTQATAKTKALYENLFSITAKGTMFGRQIPTLYGLDVIARGNNPRWEAKSGDPSDTDNSDTKYLTGSHAAVCGWDISNIELDMDRNIDNELFVDVRTHIIAAFERGAVNTISWHAANPVSGGNAWDPTQAVHTIIPGGENHEMFKERLNKVAAFLASLKKMSGEPVPLIFRPWHEHSGGGFWWGKGNTTADEFISLWRFTIEYLRDTKGLHNLIICYSPDMVHIRSRIDYLEFWPGDEWVDMLGLDAYDRYNADYGHRGAQLVRLMLNIAKEKGKPIALTETGLENNHPEHANDDYCNEKWWTKMLYKVIENQPVAFALVWRNGFIPPQGHYFGAYRGCYSEADFVEFASKERILLEKDIPNMYE